MTAAADATTTDATRVDLAGAQGFGGDRKSRRSFGRTAQLPTVVVVLAQEPKEVLALAAEEVRSSSAPRREGFFIRPRTKTLRKF
jgi:hypothetical protein